jgi:hypothetical protein
MFNNSYTKLENYMGAGILAGPIGIQRSSSEPIGKKEDAK